MKNKNKLLYRYINESYNTKESSKALEGVILEQGSPQSSCWFSSLPLITGPVTTIKAFYSWMHSVTLKGGMEPTDCGVTAKGCPSVLHTLRNTVLVKSPVEMYITVSPSGGYAYDMPGSAQLITMGTHPRHQFVIPEGVAESRGSQDLFKGKTCVKFELQVEVSTPKDIPILLMHPVYHNDSPFYVVPGIIDRPHSRRIPLSLITLIDIPTEEKTYHIKQGDILAYLWSHKHLDLDFDRKAKMKSSVPFRGSFFRGFKDQ